VVTNRGDDGPEFIKECRDAGVITPILVWCGWGAWTEMPGVTFSTDANPVERFICSVVLPA
jgi:hypothetical protein